MTRLHQGLADFRAIGSEISTSYYLALLAETYGRSGQAEAGLTVVDEALAIVDKNEERFFEAELYRLEGELMLQARGQSPESRVQEAEECFQHAITVARKQEAKALELRAAKSLARLWQQQGKTTAAHGLLSPVYDWFTEGFDTKDLQEAKALLAQLC